MNIKGNAKSTTERSITDSVDTTINGSDTTIDDGSETIPDRINILQNNLFTKSTSTPRPTTLKLTTPKTGLCFYKNSIIISLIVFYVRDIFSY